MAEHPILFKPEMIRAVLDGRKTQTRRVIKPQPSVGSYKGWRVSEGIWRNTQSFPGRRWKCPYGQVGDRLWVRETFYDRGFHHGITYRADWNNGSSPFVKKWTPSIHMPKWATRIWLEITGIRVERVQDIKLDECYAEGIIRDACKNPFYQFQVLWDSINAKRGYSWETNPWVWVIEFKRVANN